MSIDPAALVTDEQARSLAQAILSRPDYARFRTLGSEWLGGLIGRIADLLEWVRQLASATPALYWTLVGSLLLLATLLLAHVVWTVRSALVAGPPAARHPARRSGATLDQEAERLARQGRFLEAAHELHLACLETLLQEHTIELRRHDPNRTLRDRLRRAALPDEARAEFLALLDRLEVRWFRDRAPGTSDRELYEKWRQLHARLVRREAAA